MAQTLDRGLCSRVYQDARMQDGVLGSSICLYAHGPLLLWMLPPLGRDPLWRVSSDGGVLGTGAEGFPVRWLFRPPPFRANDLRILEAEAGSGEMISI